MRMIGPLLVLAGLHLMLGLVCAIALRSDAALIGGDHPALKPMKFGLSVGLLLASVALVLRVVDAPALVRDAIAGALAVTMIVEITVIVLQALRGRASHFNLATSFDAALWRTMAAAIVVAMLALVALAFLASIRPLRLDPLLAFAVRAGLWLLLLVAVSGFAMGGRGSHAVAPGGDLRVPHFFALHGLQALPICALALLWLPLPPSARWSVLVLVTLVWITIAVGTLAQAFRGRPVLEAWASRSPDAATAAGPAR